MPTWNNDKKRYEEEEVHAEHARDEREERFRTYLLNELDIIGRAIQAIEDK